MEETPYRHGQSGNLRGLDLPVEVFLAESQSPANVATPSVTGPTGSVPAQSQSQDRSSPPLGSGYAHPSVDLAESLEDDFGPPPSTSRWDTSQYFLSARTQYERASNPKAAMLLMALGSSVPVLSNAIQEEPIAQAVKTKTLKIERKDYIEEVNRRSHFLFERAERDPEKLRLFFGRKKAKPSADNWRL
jgi:hypothetical protein